MTSYLIKQLWAITPVYILNFCYGMSGGFPAITTPQLKSGCGLFDISREEESWIGTVNLNYLFMLRIPCFSVIGQCYKPFGMSFLWIPSAEIWTKKNSYDDLYTILNGMGLFRPCRII